MQVQHGALRALDFPGLGLENLQFQNFPRTINKAQPQVHNEIEGN